MNYQSLKIVVEWLVESFKCPSCNSKSSADFVEILGSAGTSINLDIICPKCNKHTAVSAQAFAMPLFIWKGSITKEQKEQNINKMKEKLDNIQNLEIKNNSNKNNNLIKDEEIILLNKKLKTNNFSIESLFENNN